MLKTTNANSYRQVCVSKSIINFSPSIHVELNERDQALISILLVPNRPFYAHHTLASRLNCSVKTVSRGLQRLRNLGLVTWKYRYNDSNIYLVNPHIKTQENIERAESFLKYFFAISFAFIVSLCSPKEATAGYVHIDFKGIYKNINHSTKNIVGGENYDLLRELVPSWVHPPGVEFIRKRTGKRKEVTMSYSNTQKDPNLSGKKSEWIPDWIPLEAEQVKATRRDMLSIAKDKIHDALALTFLKILQSGWEKEDPQLSQTDILK